jgi:hypothetical protein
MSESNNNWVCFSCKYHKRKPKSLLVIPSCIHCNKDLYCLGYKIAVPKKSKIKEWEALECSMYSQDIACLEEQKKRAVSSKHKVEKEVVLLINEKPNTKENRKRLKCYLEELDNWKN